LADGNVPPDLPALQPKEYMAEIIVVSLCIIANALLAAVEMAFVSVGKPQLRELARSGNVDAQKILALREKPERTLSILQIGITLVGALGAAVGGAGAEEAVSPMIQEQFGLSENSAEAIAILLIVLPITYLSVVVGELVPKTLALRNPLSIVLRVAKWLVLLDWFFSPIISALQWSTRKVLQVLFLRSRLASVKEPATPATDMAERLDKLSAQNRQYVLNLANLENKRVRDVMLPWEKVSRIDFSQPASEVEALVLSSGHTRLPVIKDETVIGIVGLLHTKEFTAFRKAGNEDWYSIIRPVLQVQEGDLILKALRIMQEKRSHLAVVYTQDRLVGIVTLEDIIEEIIGDIYDEDDDGALRKILSTGASFRSLGVGSESDHAWFPATKF
jgi:putative hemolysin